MKKFLLILITIITMNTFAYAIEKERIIGGPEPAHGIIIAISDGKWHDCVIQGINGFALIYLIDRNEYGILCGTQWKLGDTVLIEFSLDEGIGI